jgi:hypothetical protein
MGIWYGGNNRRVLAPKFLYCCLGSLGKEGHEVIARPVDKDGAPLWKVLCRDHTKPAVGPFSTWPIEANAPPDWDPKPVCTGSESQCDAYVANPSAGCPGWKKGQPGVKDSGEP